MQLVLHVQCALTLLVVAVPQVSARRLPIARDKFIVRCGCWKAYSLEETSFNGGHGCEEFHSYYVEKRHTLHFEAPFPNGESGPESDDDSEGGEEGAGTE